MTEFDEEGYSEEINKILIKRGFLVEPTPEDMAKIEEHDMYRASGDVICEICNKKYYHHPMIKNYRFLTKLCNGDHVHL